MVQTEQDLLHGALALYKTLGSITIPLLMRKFNLTIFAAEELREKVMRYAKWEERKEFRR